MDGIFGRLFMGRPFPPLTDRPVQSADTVGYEIPVRDGDRCRVQMFGTQSAECDALQDGDQPDPVPLTARQKHI